MTRLGTVTLNAAIDKRYVLSTFNTPGVNRVAQCEYSAGGKGLNVSRVALLLGAQVSATGFLAGYSGKFVSEQLRLAGIGDSFVTVGGETRSCINVYDQATGKTTELLEPGFDVDVFDESVLLGIFSTMVQNSDVLVASGSAPRGCSVDIYARMVTEARRRNVPIVVDTSGPMLEQALEIGPSLIKPNAVEAAAITGLPVSTLEQAVAAATALRDMGASAVLISRGPEGAVYVDHSGAWSATPPPVDAVNTVGCGDAMVAAVAIGLASAGTPEMLLSRAVAVATAASLSASTGSFTQADLDAVSSAGVTVERLV